MLSNIGYCGLAREHVLYCLTNKSSDLNSSVMKIYVCTGQSGCSEKNSNSFKSLGHMSEKLLK